MAALFGELSAMRNECLLNTIYQNFSQYGFITNRFAKIAAELSTLQNPPIKPYLEVAGCPRIHKGL